MRLGETKRVYERLRLRETRRDYARIRETGRD